MLIETLQKHSGVSESQLNYLAKTASKRYKIYQIKKRTGGHRTIAHPSRQLKAVQRWLNKVLFRSFPIHQNATAYKEGASIRENALRHADSIFTLRLDFEDFFPTFSYEDISRFLNSQNKVCNLDLSQADIEFVCRIVTRNDQLTIGSPSSPVITNVMMFDFDNYVSDLATNSQLIYTRYADDLFVSSQRPKGLEGIAETIETAGKRYQHVSLNINRNKTAYLSKRYRRSITGLVITSNHRISIGRNRKREIKSLVNSFRYDILGTDELPRLQGLLAFAMDAEDDFFQSLRRKYGDQILNTILRR